ncbi:MAG: acylneuraminate cytidylyltransferase [Methylococcaceae bacterium]
MCRHLQKNIICIIPARGGSKGIPGKNIMDFCGKPLLAWSILQARQAKAVNAVYVTSDDNAILRVAEEFGATPIRRPDELSTDTATSEATLLHAIDYIEKETATNIDVVLFLQATSPLRESADIDGAVQKMIDENADSLFSSARLEDFFIWQETEEGLKSLNFDFARRLRRQDVKPQYVENGSIYLFKPHVLRTTNNRLGGCIATYEMDFWKTWEIDSREDKALCEWYFMNRLTKRFMNLSPSAIDLIVYDFDGVMTDNRVLTLPDGTEAVFANRADGWGIGQLRKAGFRQIILSTETNSVVSARAKKLQIEVLQGRDDKARDLSNYCQSQGIDLANVLYVGNDVNDLDVMRLVGYPVAPADAHPKVLAIARHVTKARGGEGVIKEISEILLSDVGN